MKKIVALLCIMFLLMPLNVYAHSKMTESIPAENTTVSVSPEHISLTFNTEISSISTFTLLDANDVEHAIDNISVQNDKLSGDVTASLATGSYTVQWNIIGEDGHAVEGSYSFQVELAEADTPSASPEADVTTETDQPDAAETTPTAQPEQPASSEPATDESELAVDGQQEDNKSSQPIWPYLVIGLIVAVALVFALRKRK